MKLSLRSRLAAMVVVISLLAATIVGSASITWRQVGSLRRHFSSVRIESFRIADYLQANVLDLNATLLQFVLGHDTKKWQKFLLNSKALDLWLEQQRPTTPPEREDLARIRSKLMAYRAEARTIATSDDSRQADVLAVLSKIEGASQQLLSLGYELASAHRTAAAQLVEIGRLERIVREVLLFARPAEPKNQLISAVVLLREVTDLMRAQMEKSNITLTIASSADATVRGDPDQLKQVLLNLVRNAAESIGECGQITLRLRTERTNLGGRPLDAAILEVEDTGKGISPEVQKRLFDPFYTTKAAGTGLGLSMAARIVEQHAGALRYRTEVGRGTIFRIALPLIASR